MGPSQHPVPFSRRVLHLKLEPKDFASAGASCGALRQSGETGTCNSMILQLAERRIQPGSVKIWQRVLLCCPTGASRRRSRACFRPSGPRKHMPLSGKGRSQVALCSRCAGVRKPCQSLRSDGNTVLRPLHRPNMLLKKCAAFGIGSFGASRPLPRPRQDRAADLPVIPPADLAVRLIRPSSCRPPPLPAPRFALAGWSFPRAPSGPWRARHRIPRA